MFEKYKNKLKLNKMNIQVAKGIKDDSILPFDENIYRSLNKIFINGIPGSMFIKYINSSLIGKCYDKSLYLFFCIKDAIYVTGDQEDLKIKYGEEHQNHSWIEVGDYVYDASMLCIFKKEEYYNIYNPTNLKKITLENFCSTPNGKEQYDQITETTLEDLKPNGKKRRNIYLNLPLIIDIAYTSNNKDFITELNAYLELIEYNEEEIKDKNLKKDFFFF